MFPGNEGKSVAVKGKDEKIADVNLLLLFFF